MESREYCSTHRYQSRSVKIEIIYRCLGSQFLLRVVTRRNRTIATKNKVGMAVGLKWRNGQFLVEPAFLLMSTVFWQGLPLVYSWARSEQIVKIKCEPVVLRTRSKVLNMAVFSRDLSTAIAT